LAGACACRAALLNGAAATIPITSETGKNARSFLRVM
jgi:hypothetical protein